MDFLRVLTIVLVSVLGFSRCAYVENLHKCSLADKRCHKDLIQEILKDIGPTGIPELKIPPIDPISLKHINGSILGVLDLELVEGTAKGVKNCVIDSTDVNVEHLRASIELTCDVTIKGRYIVKSTSPVIKNLLGGEIHGDGNGKVKIEKITIKIEFPFEIVKRGDDTFFISELKNYKYTYHIHKNVTFFADNLYLGDKESSTEVVKLLNENWKTLIESFGNHFFDIAMKFVYKFLLRFFKNVPTKNYLTDDVAALL